MVRRHIGAAAAGFLLLPLLALAQTATSSEASTTVSSSVSATSTATTTPFQPNYLDTAVVRAKVTSYFADIPVMIAIAQCESGFRQFGSSGAALSGGSGGMIGIFQINASVHKAFALSLGFDIATVDGNIGYARYLYNHSGTDPWIDSFPCWQSASANPELTISNTTNQSASGSSGAASPIVSGSLTANLSFGNVDPQVLVLQQILNALGFTISPSGAGSPGQETTKFGSLTRASLRQYQCSKQIVCSGDEGSTGYGFVGPRTRSALLADMAAKAGTVAASAPVSNPAPAPTPTTTADHSALIAQLRAQVATLNQQIAQLQAEDQQ